MAQEDQRRTYAGRRDLMKSARDQRREFNLRTYGTNIPNSQERKAVEELADVATKRDRAIGDGFKPPTQAASGDLLKRRQELAARMLSGSREEALGMRDTASQLGINERGFGRVLNQVSLNAKPRVEPTVAGTGTAPTGTAPTGTAPTGTPITGTPPASTPITGTPPATTTPTAVTSPATTAPTAPTAVTSPATTATTATTASTASTASTATTPLESKIDRRSASEVLKEMGRDTSVFFGEGRAKENIRDLGLAGAVADFRKRDAEYESFRKRQNAASSKNTGDRSGQKLLEQALIRRISPYELPNSTI